MFRCRSPVELNPTDIRKQKSKEIMVRRTSRSLIVNKRLFKFIQTQVGRGKNDTIPLRPHEICSDYRVFPCLVGRSLLVPDSCRALTDGT